VAEPRLHEPALAGIGDVLVDDLGQLRERARGLLVLGDARTPAHHVCEGPVGHALAVGEAAAAVPVRDLGKAVEVLVELPGEPRFADAGDACDRDELRAALVGARVEEVLDAPELAVAPDEGRFQPGGLERAAGAGDDSQRLPELDETCFALELVRPGVGVHDRLVGRTPRRLPDQDRPRLGERLDAGGGVDEVACDHALPLGAEGDGGLAGQDACPGVELGCPQLVPERGDGGHQVERCPHRPLGVVLGRGRRPPDRHHRVPDELLDRASVELDQPPAGVEVA